jgi:5,6-dimethylbenzimidazole synthase
VDLYEAIYRRRDVRRFRPDPIGDDVLCRILDAAHRAGSVGLMQPWNFTIVRSLDTRTKIHEICLKQNRLAAEHYSGERRSCYDSLQLAGILEAPLSIVVTCDRSRKGPNVLGRNTMPETDIYSTCCAIQNLWLAARAEGVGVGWVSILDAVDVKSLLEIPEQIVLVAWLCVGVPVQFEEQPMLETAGWETRLPLSDVLFLDRWAQPWNPASRIALQRDGVRQ